MKNPLLLGIFADEDDIIRATRATRSAGYDIFDIYTPYAVHGLDEAMGLKPSKLTWVCLISAALGLLLAVYTQFWIGSIDWPLNVGGKPFNSLPAYLPVMFEMTILIGGLGVVFTMLFRTKLYPGNLKKLVDSRVTDDHFVLALEEKNASYDAEMLKKIWEEFHVIDIKEYMEAGK